MSCETTYNENRSINTKRQNVFVNNEAMYKIFLEKESFRKNANTGVEYTLSILCNETDIDIRVNLPHEIMYVLNEMISDSLGF